MSILLPEKPHKEAPLDTDTFEVRMNKVSASWFDNENFIISRGAHQENPVDLKQYILQTIVILEEAVQKRKEEMESICAQLGIPVSAWEDTYDDLVVRGASKVEESPPVGSSREYVDQEKERMINQVLLQRAQREKEHDRYKAKMDILIGKVKVDNNLTALKSSI